MDDDDNSWSVDLNIHLLMKKILLLVPKLMLVRCSMMMVEEEVEEGVKAMVKMVRYALFVSMI
jgi:hypothetical protein